VQEEWTMKETSGHKKGVGAYFISFM